MLKPLKHFFCRNAVAKPCFWRREAKAVLRALDSAALWQFITHSVVYLEPRLLRRIRPTDGVHRRTGITCTLHGHTCHFSLRLLVVSSVSDWIGCKMTCCGSSLPRSRYASIDMRMVHGDLAMDSGLEPSVVRWTERASALASPSPCSWPLRFITLRMCRYIIRSGGRSSRVGGGVSVRG